MKDINVLYEAHLKTPTYESENDLYRELLKFCKGVVKKRFGAEAKYYEDCITDSIIDILKGISNFKGESLFSTWVTSLTLNVCYHAQQEVIDRNEVPLNENQSNDPIFSLDNKLTMKTLIQKLAPEDQELIRLKLEGYENQEIAEKFGWTVQNVKWHYHQAIESMKQYSETKMLGEDPISKVERIGAGLVKVTFPDGQEGIVEKTAISTVRKKK